MSAPFIHPTSVIDEGALVGEDSHVWHFCHLMPTAAVGKACNIGQNVFLDNHVQVGNGVTLEDDVFIGPSVVFTNVINPRSFINRKNEFRSTLVKKGATIGANATIVCGITIGAYAMIGAGAVVTKNVADFALVVGNPGRQVGWVNEEGQKKDM